jgi:hypothetical protein
MNREAHTLFFKEYAGVFNGYGLEAGSQAGQGGSCCTPEDEFSILLRSKQPHQFNLRNADEAAERSSPAPAHNRHVDAAILAQAPEGSP